MNTQISCSDSAMQLTSQSREGFKGFFLIFSSFQVLSVVLSLLASWTSRKIQETFRKTHRKYWSVQVLGGAMTLNQCK